MDTLRNKKRAPTHPGALLREVVLPELGITQAEFAERLEVSRRTVSEILHERRPVTPDMAIRLGKLLGNGASLWLRMHNSVDTGAVRRLHAHPATQSRIGGQRYRGDFFFIDITLSSKTIRLRHLIVK